MQGYLLLYFHFGCKGIKNNVKSACKMYISSILDVLQVFMTMIKNVTFDTFSLDLDK